MAVLLLQLTHFVEDRIAFRLGTALAGSQAPVALLAPVSKVRGVETLAAEHGADRLGRLGCIGFCQDALLIFGGILAALGPDDHLGVGHRFGLTWRYAKFGVSSLGLTPRRTRRGQNDRRWWNPVYVFFFSSRRRHTRYIGDWSSDVCSSDLIGSGIRDTSVTGVQTCALPI